MGYIYQLLRLPTTMSTNCYVYWLLYSSQRCDGHVIQQLCITFAFVGISRQMLINSAIYVGHDITLFLRRTWSLFSDSSYSLNVTTILGLVTLAGLDYYSQINIAFWHTACVKMTLSWCLYAPRWICRLPVDLGGSLTAILRYSDVHGRQSRLANHVAGARLSWWFVSRCR